MPKQKINSGVVVAAVTADVLSELNRHPDLPAEARAAIEAALDGVPALVSKSRAAEVLGVAPRTVDRLLAREGAPSFKLDPHKRGARRIPRAFLARVLADAAQ